MNSVFSEQILADKLSKLNNTQQCIETLSHWCIFHQSKADLVVSTWVKEFKNADMTQKVPLLYLANDILQNSKRKGNEFVTEFWKVLPESLKELEEKGDERGKKAVSRLCDIWEERKVFGSRSSNIRELMHGKEVPPPLELNRKRSRSVRILKRDSRSVRMKLSVGGAAEKIASAYCSVLSKHLDEDDDVSKCRSAINSVKKMERLVETACASAKDPMRKSLAEQLEEKEKHLKNGIEKLKSAEASRGALVEKLKEALNEEESELENIRTQMQVAEALIEEASTWRKRLTDDNYVAVPNKESPATDAVSKTESVSKKSAAAIAAEVADKLAASTSSQYIMSSVLSTFAAEEAKSAGLAKISSSNSLPPMPMIQASANGTPNNNNNLGAPGTQTFACQQNQNHVSTPEQSIYAATQVQAFMSQQNNQYQAVYASQPLIQTQAPNSQPQYHFIAQAPPPQQQFIQTPGGMMTQYGYGTVQPMPQGQVPAPHMVSPMVQMQQPQLQQQHFMPATPQPPPPPNFRPPGIAYYAQPHYNQ